MAQDSRQCGTKRPAENNLIEDQPLAKKLGRLHIDSTNVYSRASSLPREDPSSGGTDSKMLLDDNKYTVYVHDLDREIAEIESQESSVPFLSRISEKLSPIPQSILSPPQAKGNELVLYREPSSLTVPKGQDSVRRAVMESRARARESRNEHHGSRPSRSRSPPRKDAAVLGANGPDRHEDDAMDIDEEL